MSVKKNERISIYDILSFSHILPMWENRLFLLKDETADKLPSKLPPLNIVYQCITT